MLAQVPRYFLELMAFGSMIALLLYLASYNGNLGIVLPIISVYAFVAFKLIPAFHQIYGYLAEIKGNIAAFETIKQDLIDSQKTKLMILKHNQDILYPKKQILLNNLTFTYPNAEKETISKLNLSITANNIVGIVGPSGSGKSTLIDILLGLIKPQKGFIKIDDKLLMIITVVLGKILLVLLHRVF